MNLRGLLLSIFISTIALPSVASVPCSKYLEQELNPSFDLEISRIAIETLKHSFILELCRHSINGGGWVPEYIHKYFGYGLFSNPYPHIRETEGMDGLGITTEQFQSTQEWFKRARFEVLPLGTRVFPKTLLDPIKFIKRQPDGGTIYTSHQIAVGIDAYDLDGSVRHFAMRFAYKLEDGKVVFDVSQQTGIRPTIIETSESASFADAFSSFGGNLIQERPVFHTNEEAHDLPFDEIIVDLMLSDSKGASFFLLKDGVSLKGENIDGAFRFELISENGWKRRYGAITSNKYVFFSGYIFEVDLSKNTIQVQKRSQILWTPYNSGQPILFSKE